MSSLTDEELRNKLKNHGFEAGPITPATRRVYERKLERLVNEDLQSKVTPVSPPSNRNNKPTKTPKLEDGAPPRTSPRSQNWHSRSEDADPYPALSTEPRYRSSVFYSDEPFLNARQSTQQNPGHTPIASLRPPQNMPLTDIAYNTPEDDFPRHQPKFSSGNGAQSHTSPQSFSFNAMPSPDRRSFYGRDSEATYLRRDADTSTTNSLLLSPQRDEHSRSSFWSSWQPRAAAGNTSGVLSDDSQSDDANISRWVSQAHKTNYHRQHLVNRDLDNSLFSRVFGSSLGNHIPNLILLGGIILFAVIASSYILLKDKHGSVGRTADLQKLVCQLEDIHERKNEVTQRQTVCINKDDLSGCLKIIHSLFDILSRLAGEYKCGEPVETPRMELRTAQRMLKSSFVFANQPTGQVERLWDSVVILIMEFGRKHFEIVAYNAEGEEPLSWDDVQELESLRPYIPGSCRLRLLFLSLLYFLYNLLWLSLIIAVVGGACYLIYRMKQSHQRQVNKRELRVREIVQQIASLLQQQLQRRQIQPNEPAYVPVALIKETLSRSNKDLANLWPDVESHVHLVEGCILVQEWRGVGETWQWHGGSGWQGSALIENSQRLPFTTPPTECLKVRNMFTRDAMDFNAQQRLKRELLRRISDCGYILHIGFDYQDNQGLVYIKCASPEVAGRVYEAIHANYFDSRLLTVKFLRASKYHLRFPESHAAGQPLSASDFD